MRRLALSAAALLLWAAIPALAQRAEGESKPASEAGEQGPSPVWAWANFLLLAAGLGYLVKKNAGPYFAKRSLEIRKGMIEAEEARAESDAKVAAVERRLANLQTEIEALRRDALQEGEAEAARVRREAAAEMAKIRQHLNDEIVSAGKAARLELRRYSAELALSLAEQKIAAGLSPEVQDRLVKGFVAHMAHT